MLLLLIAMQISTTNCIPDYNGGMNCTTMTPQMPQLPQMPQAPPIPQSSGGGCALCNLISIFDNAAKKRHAKHVGSMLAKGDCAGAEKYALQKGELDLADTVNAYCTRSSRPSAGTMKANGRTTSNWLLVESGKDGTEFYVDTKSIRDNGAYHSYLMRIVYPPNNSVRETNVLSFYRCRNGTNAVKTFVRYLRDGNVEAYTIDNSDLKFESLKPENATEASLINSACALHSDSN